MKKRYIIYLFSVFIFSVLIVSCSGNGEPYFSKGGITPNFYLRVSSSTLSFTNEAGSKPLSVTTNTDFWSVSCNATWLTVSEGASTRGSGNGTINVSVSENTNTEARTATITISSSSTDAVKVTVTQAAAPEPTISFETSSVTFVSDAVVTVVKLNATKSWTIESDMNWLTISPTSGTGDATVNLIVSENILTLTREGIITAKMDNKTATLKIKQEAMSFPLIYNTWTWDTSATDGAVWGNMGYCGGSGADVGINSSGKWWGVTNEEDLLKQLSDSGTGVATGEESMNAYMIISDDGYIRSYDKNDKIIREGSFYVERVDGSDWKVGNLHCSPASFLFPFEIYSKGRKPEITEIVYITSDKMTLVYPDGGDFGSLGSWGEATYWHFARKGSIINKPKEGDNETPPAPVRNNN